MSINAVVSTPSISTFPSLVGPISQTKGLGLWYSGAGTYPPPRSPSLITLLFIVKVIALAELVAASGLGPVPGSGWHWPVGEEYHPPSLLPLGSFPN